MVSQQFLLSHQRLDGIEEARQLSGIAHVGRFVAKLTVNLRQRRCAQRIRAVAQIDQQQQVILIGLQLWRDGATDIFDAGKSGNHQRQR